MNFAHLFAKRQLNPLLETIVTQIVVDTFSIIFDETLFADLFHFALFTFLRFTIFGTPFHFMSDKVQSVQ